MLLRTHGIEMMTVASGSRVAALREELERLYNRSIVETETLGARVSDQMAGARSLKGASTDQYTTRLDAEFKRAGVDIYKAIRLEGVASVRAWLKDNYVGYKGPGATQWTDLWSLACQVDMAIGQCGTDAEIVTLLNSDDRLEVALRHLGAYFYEVRTGDKTGAAHMRAHSTPGTARDIVPAWMINEATTFSKAEFQRSERVTSEVKKRGKGRGKGKEDGKEK